MKKVFATLAAVALLGALVLAITALAGATPGTSSSSKAERVLFALLKGRNEIGPDGRRGAGDPDGRGGFTALIANNQVCFGLTVDNIAAPVAAHIHRGRPSQNGPIVVTFAPLPGSGDPGASGGCVPPDGGNTAVLEEILKHPNHFYACTRAPSPAGLSAASSSTGARSAAGAVGSTGRGPPARRPAEEFDSVMRETPWLLRKARWASPLFVRAARAGAQGTPPGRG